MRRLFIAMQDQGRRLGGDRHPNEFRPRNYRMYDTAGQARNYSMVERTVKVDPTAEGLSVREERRGWRRERVDSGHVLIVDLDSLPRVKFSDKGKAIGLGVDGTPSLLDEYENAERMIEVWATRASELRVQLGKVENERQTIASLVGGDPGPPCAADHRIQRFGSGKAPDMSCQHDMRDDQGQRIWCDVCKTIMGGGDRTVCFTP